MNGSFAIKSRSLYINMQERNKKNRPILLHTHTLDGDDDKKWPQGMMVARLGVLLGTNVCARPSVRPLGQK